MKLEEEKKQRKVKKTEQKEVLSKQWETQVKFAQEKKNKQIVD